MLNYAFQPRVVADLIVTYNVSASSTTAQQALEGASAVRIANLGAATVFVNFGTKNAVAVAATSMPVLAGAVEVLSVPSGAQYICMITASTSFTVNVTPGDGV